MWLSEPVRNSLLMKNVRRSKVEKENAYEGKGEMCPCLKLKSTCVRGK
jgi:hypothetical protein